MSLNRELLLLVFLPLLGLGILSAYGEVDFNTEQIKGSMTCSNGQILEYNSATDTWDCGTDDTGGGSADTITEGDTNVETIDAGTGQIDFDVDGSLFARITSAIFDFNENIARDISYFINGTNNLFFPQGGSQTLLGDLLLTDDFTIINNDGTYIAFDGDASVVSSNSDLDTVWTAVKAHTDYVNKDAIKVQFGTGEFHSDVGLDVQRSNTTIAGNGVGVTWFYLDVGAPEQTPMWTVGTEPVFDKDNFVDASLGDISVTLDTVGNATDYLHDDWVVLESNFHNGLASYQLRGELQRVNATAGTGNGATGVVTFNGKIFEDYTTIDSVSPSMIRIPNMLENVVLKDFSSTDLRPEGTVSLNTRHIETKFIENLSIDSVQVEHAGYVAIGMDAIVHGKVSNCHIRDTNLVAGLSYGINVRGVSNGITITGCTFENNRYALTVNGGSSTWNGETRNILIDGNTMLHPNFACVDTHEGVHGLVISNNSCIGRSEQQVLVSTDTTTSNCWKMRSGGIIEGNMCKNVDHHGVNAFSQTVCVNDQNCNVNSISKLVVNGNHFENIGSIGIYMENSTDAIVSDNTLLNVESYGIQLTSGGFNREDGVKYFALITDNTLRNVGLGATAIWADYKVDVIGNSLFNTGGASSSGNIHLTSNASNCNDGYDICGVSGSRILDNRIEDSETPAIRVNRGNALDVSGNYMIRTHGCMQMSAQADYDGSNSTITHNRCEDTGYPDGNANGFYLEEIVGSLISDNFFSNVTGASGAQCALRIEIDADDNIIRDNVFTDVTCKLDIQSGNNTIYDNYCLSDCA